MLPSSPAWSLHTSHTSIEQGKVSRVKTREFSPNCQWPALAGPEQEILRDVWKLDVWLITQERCYSDWPCHPVTLTHRSWLTSIQIRIGPGVNTGVINSLVLAFKTPKLEWSSDPIEAQNWSWSCSQPSQQPQCHQAQSHWRLLGQKHWTTPCICHDFVLIDLTSKWWFPQIQMRWKVWMEMTRELLLVWQRQHRVNTDTDSPSSSNGVASLNTLGVSFFFVNKTVC